MAKRNKRKRIVRRIEPILRGEEALKLWIDYKNHEELSKFVSDRAKIYGRRRTGLNAKRQRRLALAIKRARHLALIPFSQTV